MQMTRPRGSRPWGTLTLIAVTASALMVGLSGTAQASNTPVPVHGQRVRGGGAIPADQSACDAYRLCLWQNADFNDFTAGSFWSYSFFTNPDATWDYVGPKAANQASSLENNRDLPTFVSSLGGGGGLRAKLPASYVNTNLGGYFWPGTNVSMNDSIVSFYFCETSSCPGG